MAEKKRSVKNKEVAEEKREAYQDWQVESDLQTLIAAEKIKKDKNKMAKIRELAKNQINRIKTITAEPKAKEVKSDEKTES